MAVIDSKQKIIVWARKQKIIIWAAIVVVSINIFHATAIAPPMLSNSNRDTREYMVIANLTTSEQDNVPSIASPMLAVSTRTSLGGSLSTNSSNTDPMMECRMQLESWLRPKIQHWIHQDLPLLDWVSVLPDGTLHIQFVLAHLMHTYNKTSQQAAPKIRRAKWYCGTDTYKEPAVLHFVKRSNLVFLRCNRTSLLLHHSKMGEEIPTIMTWAPELNPERFNLQPMMDCDTTEQRYGKPKNHINIAMCSVLYGDDWRTMMPIFAEYYAYHKILGVQHFWVFVNTDVRPAQPLPRIDDITFIPYNYRWKQFQSSSLPYGGVSVWQEAMQNQCLSRLRRYGVDWVSTIDVDEHIDIRQEEIRTSDYPLKTFLARYVESSAEPIAGIKMGNVPFQFNSNDGWKDQFPYRMAMDFTYRFNSTHTSFVDFARPKLIYSLKYCDTAGVHWCRRPIPKSKVIYVDILQEIMLHHFKLAVRTALKNINPILGYWRGMSNPGEWVVKDSTMTDAYRTKVCHEMIRGPFASFITHLDEDKCNDWPPLRIANESSHS